MDTPFITTNDVNIGERTTDGFTLVVNGREPIKCTYAHKYERERFKNNPKITCYPYYYINVIWAPNIVFQTTNLELAKRWVVEKTNRHLEQAEMLAYRND